MRLCNSIGTTHRLDRDEKWQAQPRPTTRSGRMYGGATVVVYRKRKERWGITYGGNKGVGEDVEGGEGVAKALLG